MPTPKSNGATRPAEFFERLGQVHNAACQAAGGRSAHFFNIAGRRVELAFAGTGLERQILPALEHLRSPRQEGSADLTVSLWDSVSTGQVMPAPPWRLEDCAERGEVRGFNNERFQTAYFLGSGVLNMLDRKRNEGLFWVRDGSSLAIWESGAPLLALLNWWFSDETRQLVHAAAIGYPEGGILLAGKGGSGKSTTALASLDTDLFYAGDDYCLLEVEPELRVHSLYNSAKLNRDNLARFPGLGRLFDRPSARIEEKALVFLRERAAAKLTAGFPLQGVFLPRVTGLTETTLEPISPARAMRALAPSSLFQLCGAGKKSFRVMAGLIREVPCHQLNLGTDLNGVTTVIRNYLGTRNG